FRHEYRHEGGRFDGTGEGCRGGGGVDAGVWRRAAYGRTRLKPQGFQEFCRKSATDFANITKVSAFLPFPGDTIFVGPIRVPPQGLTVVARRYRRQARRRGIQASTRLA